MPVAIYIMLAFLGSAIIQLIPKPAKRSESVTQCQFLPPLVVFHKPPECEPAKIVSGRLGTAYTHDIKPACCSLVVTKGICFQFPFVLQIGKLVCAIPTKQLYISKESKKITFLIIKILGKDTSVYWFFAIN